MNHQLRAQLPPLAQATLDADHELALLGRLVPGGHLVADDLRRRGNVLHDRAALHRQFWSDVSARESAARAAGVDSLLGLRTDDRELTNYSVSRAIAWQTDHARVNDAALEVEVNQFATKRSGQVAAGCWYPLGLALRTAYPEHYRNFDASGATEAAPLIGAERRYGADPLRRVSPLLRLGATLVPNLRVDISFPSFGSTTLATWKSETASATAITESTTAHTIACKRAAVSFTYSRQAFFSSPDQKLDQVISRHLLTGCLELLSNGAINGDGSSDSPVGVLNTANIGSVVGGASGATLLFSHLRDIESKPLAANAQITEPGWLVNAPTWTYLRTLPIGSGLPYALGSDSRLMGQPTECTNHLVSDGAKGGSGNVLSTILYSAQWDALLLGVFGAGLDLTVDRITAADRGLVKITAALYCGATTIVPSAFSAMTDAKLS